MAVRIEERAMTRKLAQLFSVLAAIGLTAGCATQAELNQIGEEEFRRIDEQAPLVKDQATINYVACVANAIVDVLEPPWSELYWELRIVDTPMVNASVLPGGKMVVYKGILDMAQNQHQLAAVIASIARR